MESTPTNQQHGVMRILIWIGVVLLIAVLAFLGTRNTALFRAAITEVGTPGNVTQTFYIPDNYSAPSPDVDLIEVKVGGDVGYTEDDGTTFVPLVGFAANIRFPEIAGESPIGYDATSMLVLDGTIFDGVAGVPLVTPDANDSNLIVVTFNANPGEAPVSAAAGQTLFKLRIEIASGLNPETQLEILNPSLFLFEDDALTPTVNSDEQIDSGRITISGIPSCDQVECGEHGVCNATLGICDCNDGYDGLACNQCDEGYTGFPDCVLDVFKDLTGIILTLSQETLNSLTTEQREQAFGSAYVLINSLEASGETITVEGTDIDIPDPDGALDCTADQAACLTDIANQMIDSLEDEGLTAAPFTNVPSLDIPGALLLVPTAANANNSIEISSSTGAVRVVPGLGNGLILNTTDSFQTELIGKFADGSIQTINFDQVVWQPQPVNRLNNEALNGGLLEPGDVVGSGPIHVEVAKADDTTVPSNTVVVTVPRGPIIQDIQRIGVGSVVKGSVVDLRVKISDASTIEDIADITVFLQSLDGSQTFDTTVVQTEVTVEAEGEEDVLNDDGETVSENFRIYNMPITVPFDANLFDGNYQLVIEITDTLGLLATGNFPLTIGAAEKGDINGDGQLNNIDVGLLFRIVDGSFTATDAQMVAADMNSDGTVDETDTQLLFDQLSRQ